VGWSIDSKVPACLHLATHTTPGAVRMLARLRGHRDRIERGPGVIAGHLFATIQFAALTGGRPTLRRWALLCAFTHDEELEAFERSTAVAAFHHRARESWRVTLDPIRLVRGSWRGWLPADDETDGLGRDEPLAVMTYGVLRPRYVPRFLRYNRRIIRASMHEPGLVARIGLSDTPLTASTFSIWRNQGDAARFAYGPGSTHKPVIRPSLDTPWAEHDFFARFRLRDSRGRWEGHDPVAAANASANGGAVRSAGADDHALDPGQVAQPAH
jgi:hypothetical protein